MTASLALCLAVPHQHEKGWLGLALTSWALPGDGGHIPSSCLHAPPPPREGTWMPAAAVVPAASPMELWEPCGEQYRLF